MPIAKITTEMAASIACDDNNQLDLAGYIVARNPLYKLPCQESDQMPDFVSLIINGRITVVFETTEIAGAISLERMETPVVEKLYYLLGNELQDRALAKKLDKQLEEQD